MFAQTRRLVAVAVLPILVLATGGAAAGASVLTEKRSAAPPTHDAFENAREIISLPFVDEVVTTDALIEPGESPASCAPDAVATVWYRFAFDEDTSIRIETSHSNHDTGVAVYRGQDLASLTQSACNDDFVGYIPGPGRVQMTARGGTTYHVQAVSTATATDDAGESVDPILRISFTSIPKPAGLAEVVEFETTGDDGVPLKGNVYLPDVAGPFATLLEYSPYWDTAYIPTEGAEVAQEDRSTLWDWLGPYLDAGFAVAIVNSRGAGKSGGCAQWGSRIDATDAAAVIEALATQDWSNGKVGMIGLSFPGWMQYLAISAAPDALKAAAPASGVIDFHSLITRNGAAVVTGPVLSTVFTSIMRGVLMPLAPMDFGSKPFIPSNSPDQVACPRYGEDVWEGLGTYANADWTAGDRTAYFEERDLRDEIDKTKVAIFAANGLNANNEMHILQFEGLWDLMSNDRRLLLGQWDHDYPKWDAYPDETIEWFDHYLREGSPVKERGLVEYQDTAGNWHTANHWPPHGPTEELYLSDGALVSHHRDVQPSQQTFVSSDSDPYAEDCPDRALYVSEPLAESVVLAGNAEFEFTVTSDLPDGNVSAFLWHRDGVPPCGEVSPHAIELAAELLRYPDEVARAQTDLRHRGSDLPGEPFPTGVPTTIRVRSNPFATFVPAGERLVLAIGGGSIELLPDVRKPLLTVSTGPGMNGSISIPVVEGHLRFERDDMRGPARAL